ncbi:MAG: InlB B-repeat-containing protein [Spirochaetes bacterium]|nr:InlB B-repeat-containing protein [Spirochaetota bacterium]
MMERPGTRWTLAITGFLFLSCACLFAQTAHSVAYDGNGKTSGSVPVDKGKYVSGKLAVILDNTGKLARTGYRFGGWNTARDGSGKDIAAGAKYRMPDADVTLYAKWIFDRTQLPKTWSYKVIFDGQSATTQANPENKTVSGPATTVGALPVAPTRKGHAFGGWYTAPKGAGTKFTATTPVTANLTVHAKWTPVVCTVIFDGQGATTAARPAKLTITGPETTVGKLPSMPVREGYNFDGWFTAPKGGGAQFTGDTEFAANITVYAKWTKPYALGDTGPAGGLVFHDKGKFTDGWRYLEAAPSDQSTGMQWWDEEIRTGATGTAVGTGKANTEAIVKALGTGSYAAKTCSDLVLGGRDDWFLPSKDELNLMYWNLKKAGSGGFAAWYWSSSEKGVGNAWLQYFDDGTQSGDYGVHSGHVRAVRAF